MLLLVALFLALNLAVDVIYALIDPRIRNVTILKSGG
jgi:ABC-type dipeptide/oligopeptide/nickel transport system permease component